MAYVGEGEPAPTVKAGMLCRVSLSKQWQPHPDVSFRYYVQLSGWYE